MSLLWTDLAVVGRGLVAVLGMMLGPALPMHAAGLETYSLGDAILAVPVDWTVTNQRRGVEVDLTGPKGESLMIYWWFPDEPLTGYDGAPPSETRVFPAGPALMRRDAMAGRRAVSAVFEWLNPDGERLIFMLESETEDLAAVETVLEPFLQNLRFVGMPVIPAVSATPPAAALSTAPDLNADDSHDVAGDFSFLKPKDWAIFASDLPGVRLVTLLPPTADAVIQIAFSSGTADRSADEVIQSQEALVYQEQVIPRQIDGESFDPLGGFAGHAVTLSARVYAIGGISLPYTKATAWIFRGVQADKAVLITVVHAVDAPDALRQIAESLTLGPVIMTTPDAVTFMAEDGRGYLTVTKGPGVLAPNGIAALVPPGRQSSYEEGFLMEWSAYGWPSSGPEFIDNGDLVQGWHFVRFARRCLAGQFPVALLFGGTERFTSGDALSRIEGDLVVNWPAGVEPCVLENAGVGNPSTSVSGAATAKTELELPIALPPETPAVSEPATVPEAQAVLPPPPPPAPPVVIEVVADPDSFTDQGGGYSLYQNARFGSEISFPSSYFKAEPPPENGDGRRFSSADAQSYFLIFGQHDAFGLSQDSMMEQDRASADYDDVSYEKSGQGWYVLSGPSGDAIFYRKVLLAADGIIHVFEIRYPESLKAAFDPVVAHMAQSLGPVGSQVAASPVGAETWVVVGHIQHQAYVDDGTNRPKIASMEAKAETCGLRLFWDFAGKFDGFGAETGTVVVVDGFVNLSDAAAVELLASTRVCFPDAHLMQMFYGGE